VQGIAMTGPTSLLAALGMNAKRLPRWAIYCGRISFGLYVYHDFGLDLTGKLIPHVASLESLLNLIKGVISLVITFVLAAISYHFFETPFLKIKKRFAAIESQPIA